MDLGFEVVDFAESDHVEPGEQAPDFTRPLVNDEYWADASLSELAAENPVLLVFHPMDGDFPATYIWQEVRDRDWLEYDAQLVGLSISTPYEHKEFIREWNGFDEFQFFSDPANSVAEEYGIVHDLDGMAGIAEPKPAVFLIDEEMTVEWAWVAETWPDFPPYDAIEAELAEL
ncbi:redoxin domain-containing protein [Halosegnis sp.]|uniref:redoxin domain-containing protein n=1 Tax=Halosegnis sp. TaxID=2864959 RepID=UPI0035D3EB1B